MFVAKTCTFPEPVKVSEPPSVKPSLHVWPDRARFLKVETVLKTGEKFLKMVLPAVLYVFW